MASSIGHDGEQDDNLETFSICWLDADVNNDENLAAQKKLRAIINCVRTFQDSDEFMARIHHMCSSDLTMIIVSGQMGRVVVPEIHSWPQVTSIYIYCMNKAANEQWSRSYTKVKAVCIELDELINQIRMDHKKRVKIAEPLSLNILERSSTGLDGQFLHSQLLIGVLLRMKPDEKDKRDLITLCKNEYKNNDGRLKEVVEFEREYVGSKAIWWYTRECFVYKMLNKALRVLNVDVLFLYRTVMKDIYEQLSGNQCTKRVRVYRGQYMSSGELKQLGQCKDAGGIISMNSFLSTSTDRRVAMNFIEAAGVSGETGDRVPVLFEIDADPQVLAELSADTKNSMKRPFANISKLSAIDDESEVLFMVGSMFHLNDISHHSSSSSSSSTHLTMSIIRLTLCSDHDNDLKQFYHHMNNDYDTDQTNLLSLGDVLRRMGKSDVAEKYYRRLLSELPSHDPSLSDLYHRLGLVGNARGEYEKSLEWYQKSLEIDQRTRPSDHVRIGNTHNCIGEVYRKRGDAGVALEWYNRAVSLFEQADDYNHPYLASFCNNIGNIYYGEKKYGEALDFYEKSLVIKRKHLPGDHPDLGASYNNIGGVHHCLGDYDVALEYYNRALAIKLKSLPAEHPDVAMTYKNMGVVYEVKDELAQALTLLQKASTIYQAALPSDHPDITWIRDSVRRVEDKMKKQQGSAMKDMKKK